MNRSVNLVATSALWLFAASLLLPACKPNNAAPLPIPTDQIPAEMNKAFAGAKPEAKQMVDRVMAALQSKDYPAAYQAGQQLSATPDITKKQLLVTARAMLEINALIKAASEQGDRRASGFIEYQKHNR